jgi:cytochrome b involved in lipid metabolism
LRIPPSILKQHNKRDDAWTAIYGKVYNITAYLPFHPGGVKALMRAAGRDGTKLFGLYILSTRLYKKSVSCLDSNYPRLGKCRFYA